MSNLYNDLLELSNKIHSKDEKVSTRAKRDLKILSIKLTDSNKAKLFFVKHEDKPFYTTLCNLLKGIEVSDNELAISLSSLLTYCLIEVRDDPTAYSYLRINHLSSLLNNFILGDGTQERVRGWIAEYGIL